MRYDYYAGEGFGIHARLGTVNTQQWHIAMNINMTLLMLTMRTLNKVEYNPAEYQHEKIYYDESSDLILEGLKTAHEVFTPSQEYKEVFVTH